MSVSEGRTFIIFGHGSRFPKPAGFIVFAQLGALWRPIETFFAAILDVFGGRWIFYFFPFCSVGERSRFIIFGPFGRFWRAAYLLFSAISAIFGGGGG